MRIIPKHRQNPPEISCLSFQLSPALLSHLALTLATSAGTAGSQVLRRERREGGVSYFKQESELWHACAISPSPRRQPLWTLRCPGQAGVDICLPLTGLKGLSAISRCPVAARRCSPQPCAGRQGHSTPLGVCALGGMGAGPGAQEGQLCHSSVPPRSHWEQG